MWQFSSIRQALSYTSLLRLATGLVVIALLLINGLSIFKNSAKTEQLVSFERQLQGFENQLVSTQRWIMASALSFGQPIPQQQLAKEVAKVVQAYDAVWQFGLTLTTNERGLFSSEEISQLDLKKSVDPALVNLEQTYTTLIKQLSSENASQRTDALQRLLEAIDLFNTDYLRALNQISDMDQRNLDTFYQSINFFFKTLMPALVALLLFSAVVDQLSRRIIYRDIRRARARFERVMVKIRSGQTDIDLSDMHNCQLIEFRILENTIEELDSALTSMTSDIESLSEKMRSSTLNSFQGTMNNREAIRRQVEFVLSTNQNAQALADSAQAVNAMAANISDIARVSEQLSQQLTSMLNDAQNNGQQTQDQLQQLSATVAELQDHNSQVSNSTQMIQGIAEQTNLLALNAAIEAARAGESGRGFAVVADEVRALAARSSTATQDIDQSINQVATTMNETSQQMNASVEQMGQSMDRLTTASENISALNDQVAQSHAIAGELIHQADTQVQAITQMLQQVKDLEADTQQMQASLEQTTQDTSDVSQYATNLNFITQKYLGKAQEIADDANDGNVEFF